MDTRQVYEKLMLEHFFNKMKRLRNEWSETTGDNKTGLISFIDIAGLDQRRYKVIMESCNEYIYEMLPFIVAELLRAYEIPVQFYDLRCSGADLYYIGDNQQLWIRTCKRDKSGCERIGLGKHLLYKRQ